MKKHFLVLFGLILAVAAIGAVNGLRLYRDLPAEPAAPEYLASAEELALALGNPDSPVIGASAPAVTIVEFADFACPHCQRAFSAIREVSVRHQDRVKVVFRHYPVIAEHSPELALAAECAGEQGRFWAMHDTLFLNQGVSANAAIKELARQIGLDGASFDACLDGKKYLDRITRDFEDAQALKITGTPTWFFNNIRIAGDIPPDTFFGLIDSLLTAGDN